MTKKYLEFKRDEWIKNCSLGLKYLRLKDELKELKNIHRIIKEEHRAFLKNLKLKDKKIKQLKSKIKELSKFVNNIKTISENAEKELYYYVDTDSVLYAIDECLDKLNNKEIKWSNI